MSESGFAVALRTVRERRGLSQLDLALRVQTTQRHVSFLERERSLPGRRMVVRLAEALELPLRERNDLLHAAGFTPLYPTSEVDDPVLRPVLDAVHHVLDGHLPYPAIVINRHGGLVAANEAIDVLTEGAANDLCGPGMNMYRLALHPDGMAPRIGNRTQWSGHILERLRQESIRNPDSRLETLLAELTDYTTASPATESHPSLGFAVPLQLDSTRGPLQLLTTLTTFATATDVTIAELKLEAFLPADHRTATALSRTLRD